MVTRYRHVTVLFSILILMSAASRTPAQQPEVPAANQHIDLLGDALPQGAIARMGTVRFNPGNMVNALAFSPDGTRLAIWARDWLGSSQSRLIFADVATGRELKTAMLPLCNLLALRWLADERGLAFVKLNAGEYFIWEFTDQKTALPIVPNPVLNSTRQGDPLGIAISPDGRWLATGRSSFDSSAQPIELWEIKPNMPLSQLKSRELGRQSGSGQYLLFSPDSKLVFALSRKREQQPAPPVPAGPGPVPVGPAKMAERAQLVVYEASTGKKLSEFDVAPPLTYAFTIEAAPAQLALSPDGKSLYLGDENGAIHIYDWAAGKESSSFMAHPAGDPKQFQSPGVAALALSRDGKTLYSSGFRSEPIFWNAQTGKQLVKVPELLSGVAWLAMSPDGSKLAVSESQISSLVRIVDAKTGKDLSSQSGQDVIRHWRHGGYINGLTILRDGTAVTVSVDQTIRRWQLESGREIEKERVQVSKSQIRPLGLTADGRGVFGYDDDYNAVYFDVTSQKFSMISQGRKSLVCARSGSLLLVQTEEDKLRLWEVESGLSKQSLDPPLQGQSVRGKMCGAISPDSRRVAYATTAMVPVNSGHQFASGKITLFDAANGQVLRQWQTPDAQWEHVTFSPDGRFLLVGGRPLQSRPWVPPDEGREPTLPISAKSALVLLDGLTGEPIRAFEPGFKRSDDYHNVESLAFSPNSFLFAAAQYDDSICIYELATGNILHTFRGHRNEVTQLAFTADGRRLVSVSRDNTGLVWDTSIASMARPQAIVTLAERDKVWEDLAKPEWALAGPALAALAAEPKVLRALVHEKLAAATTPDVDGEATRKLAAQLGDQIFAVRERASAALVRLSREVLPLLQGELARSTNAEQRRRLQAAIGAITRSPIPSPQLRQTRILAVLEQIRTEDSRAELKRLAEGHPEAALTRDAKAALAR
jgi:WD40 repeat protein